MYSWKNITIHLKNWNLNEAIDILEDLDVISFNITEKKNDTEEHLFGELANQNNFHSDKYNLIILVRYSTNTESIIKIIKRTLDLSYLPEYSESLFKNRDWLTYNQKSFDKITISKKLKIITPWHSNQNFGGKTVVISPGAGFGTGKHPTTKLCLNWISKNIQPGNSLLDYGTGSGILGITAWKFGSRLITCVDNDENAIKNAKENNRLNNSKINFVLNTDFKINQTYDIVMANILSNVLIEIEPILKMVSNSKLILSGLLNKDEKLIRQKYSWCNFKKSKKDNGWLMMDGTIK